MYEFLTRHFTVIQVRFLITTLVLPLEATIIAIILHRHLRRLAARVGQYATHSEARQYHATLQSFLISNLPKAEH